MARPDCIGTASQRAAVNCLRAPDTCPGAVRAVRRRPAGIGGLGINRIVIGLGNPGDQYRETRHNVGWMVLDRMADRAGWAGRGRTRDAASIVQGRYKGVDLTLAKPLTYMNDSGIAVRKILAREHAPLN